MLDVEPLIQNELLRLAPYDPDVRGDWSALLVKAGTGPAATARLHRLRVPVLALVALLVAVIIDAPARTSPASARHASGTNSTASSSTSRPSSATSSH